MTRIVYVGRDCPECGATGWDGRTLGLCAACDGQGETEHECCGSCGADVLDGECPACEARAATEERERCLATDADEWRDARKDQRLSHE